MRIPIESVAFFLYIEKLRRFKRSTYTDGKTRAVMPALLTGLLIQFMY